MKRTRMAEANCFLGLDNPRQHEQDSTLLSSIRFFITNSRNSAISSSICSGSAIMIC